MVTATPANWIHRDENGVLRTKWVNSWKQMELSDRPKPSFKTYEIVTLHGDAKGNDVN